MVDFFRNVWREMGANPAIIVAVVAGVAGLLVALVTGGFSLWNSWRALEQTRALTHHQNTLNLLERFSGLYFAEGRSRMIGLYVVDMMTVEGLQRGLRRFVVTDLMRKNFGGPKPASAFDEDHDDWIVLGDAPFNLRNYWGKDRRELPGLVV